MPKPRPPTWESRGRPSSEIVRNTSVAGTPSLEDTVSEADATQTDTVPSLIPIVFGFVNVGTGLSASQAYRMVAGSTAQADQRSATMPLRGSIAAITFDSSANKTAGTATFIAYVSNAATAATLTWANSTSTGYANFAKGITFSAGQAVDLRLTTDGSMAPTTNDVIATLWVSLNPQSTL